MDNDRLTKRVFNHDYNTCMNNWSSNIKHIMDTIGLSEQYNSREYVDITSTKQFITNHYANKWERDIQTVPEVRTYKLFKRE